MIYTLKNGQELNIRSLAISDAEQCIQLMLQVDRESKFLSRNDGEFTLTLQDEERFIQRTIDNQRKVYLVAEIDGKIVGNCSLDPVGERQRFLHRCVIGITILRDFWNLGIGTLLIGELMSYAKHLGYEQMELEVVVENVRAIALYKKLGFEIHGTKPRALKYLDGSYADEYIMTKYL